MAKLPSPKDRLKVKHRLEEEAIALRAAKELQEGWYVNLGFGIPTLISALFPLPDKAVFLMTEVGLLSYGSIATQEEADAMGWLYIDASGHPVRVAPGMSIFHIAEAFDMIRSRKLDVTILGALQVSEKGDLANWTSPGLVSSIGGAMDLAVGAKRVFVCMTHTTKNNEPKIVKECTVPLTAKSCVNLIFTDISVIEVSKEGLVLREVAPGWTPEEVQAVTQPGLIVSPQLTEIEL